ncbi:MAG: DEAD/DEAH box helicase [Candidatus Electryonea clarkiae]|nr:DEAD/DEAH box helicase [Candidatus Electryonea clarkiae]
MNKKQYIEKLERNIEEILDNPMFINHKNQILAWRISETFSPTYKEDFLWKQSLSISTNGCILLLEDVNNKLAIRSLKECAEVYEYLSEISEEYDKEYLMILSSICYDIAGYQANAYCIARSIDEYNLVSKDNDIDLSVDNHIIFHITQILLKKIPYSSSKVQNDHSFDVGNNLFNKCVKSFYDNILKGTDYDIQREIQKVYIYFMNESNLPISHLLFLLKTRIYLYLQRSIWKNLLRHENIKDNPTWNKYIRLLTNDLYSDNQIKAHDKRLSKFEFWISQLRAIEHGLLSKNKNFVIQMPTSTGKTFIAELSIIDQLIKNPNKKCIYIAPFRALTNEIERELSKCISKLGFSVSTLSGSYEIDEFQQIILEDTDVLVATPEKTDLLLRLNPDFFNEVSLLVVDEGHIVGDISPRSSLLEFLIIRLRIKVPLIRILFLSAVMPPANADEYSQWLNDQKEKVIRSLLYKDSPPDELWEPTRKLIGKFEWKGNNGRITYKDVKTENKKRRQVSAFVPSLIRVKQYADKYPTKSVKAQTAASLGFELVKDGSCLIFCSQPKFVESVGNYLIKIIDVLENKNKKIPKYLEDNQERESYYYAKKWFGNESFITKCLRRGIGIHFGDLPEPVRRSVESEFNSGKLQILISTSTVGQGLNFPIKHLIVHSIMINYINKPILIKVRDFWNIIGRAGRAGKETEGQVIFIINSTTDEGYYRKYTNYNEIEPAYSMFYNVLNALIKKRIDNDTQEKYVQILSEPYLLNLLIEESIGTVDENIIEEIINNSLFKIQAESKNIDLEPIRKSLINTISKIREKVPDRELLKVYGETGFCLESNQAIERFIVKNRDAIEAIIDDNKYLEFIKCFLKLLDRKEIDEATSYKLDKINSNPSIWYEIIKMWVEGKDIAEIQVKWLRIGEKIEILNLLISDGFYYRYSWTITSFITILLHKFNLEREDLPENIRNLPSYMKFGLNNSTACLARSIGIKNRDIALLLYEKSGSLTGKKFIRWLANLTEEDINTLQVNHYDMQNIIETAVKLNPNRYFDIPKEFTFFIKGIPYDEIRIQNSLLVKKGDHLLYQRDIENKYDPFAIKLYYNDIELGFIPREYSKLISTEIDLNIVEYEIVVVKAKRIRNYRNIGVKMRVA